MAARAAALCMALLAVAAPRWRSQGLATGDRRRPAAVPAERRGRDRQAPAAVDAGVLVVAAGARPGRPQLGKNTAAGVLQTGRAGGSAGPQPLHGGRGCGALALATGTAQTAGPAETAQRGQHRLDRLRGGRPRGEPAHRRCTHHCQPASRPVATTDAGTRQQRTCRRGAGHGTDAGSRRTRREPAAVDRWRAPGPGRRGGGTVAGQWLPAVRHRYRQ